MLREKSTLIATFGCVCEGVWWIIVYAGGCLLILRLVTQHADFLTLIEGNPCLLRCIPCLGYTMESVFQDM